jgi:hypothetical protein
MKNIKNISLVALLATSIANSSLVLADQNPIFTAQDSKCTLEAEKIYKELNKKIS